MWFQTYMDMKGKKLSYDRSYKMHCRLHPVSKWKSAKTGAKIDIYGDILDIETHDAVSSD